MKQFNNLTMKFFSNFLIIFSIVNLGYIYFPFLKLFFIKPIVNEQFSNNRYYINIPKINAFAEIFLNVNPWDSQEYNQVLKNGIAHARGTSIPGEKGTSFLFAHSSGNPWTITRYNTSFFLLGRLKKGDEIEIIKNNNKLKYSVFKTKIVWPNEVSYLTSNLDKNQLILQTCWPIGTSLKRLLVLAEPK